MFRVLLALSATLLIVSTACESTVERAYNITLKNAETELVGFYNLPPDTSINFGEADSLYNYMDYILEHYDSVPEHCSSRTYFEEGGRAVTYYYTFDTLHHITYGEWEQIAPDSVYMRLSALAKGLNQVIEVANGNFRMVRESKGHYSFTAPKNRAENSLVLLPFLSQLGEFPDHAGVFPDSIASLKTRFDVVRIDELDGYGE